MSQADGGPAFPSPDTYNANGHVQCGDPGMSLRDYFIAHAPAEPQPWFAPKMAPRPVASVWVSDDGQRKYLNPKAAYEAEDDCFSLLNADEIARWDADYIKQKYTQWPAAWADEMIQQRSQP